MVISRKITKNRLSQPEANSILRQRLHHGLFHHHLYEGPEVLLKTDSVIRYVKNRLHDILFRVTYTKSMKKRGSVADLKNNKTNYKDTRITFDEAVLVSFFVVILNMF